MEFVKLITDLIQKNGLSFVIVLMFLALIAGLGILGFKWALKVIDHMRINGIGIDQDDLANHAVFQTIRKNINYDIHNLVIGEKLREAIFRDFLMFVFSSTRDELQNFLNRGNLDKMDDSLYKTRLLETIDSMIKGYEGKAITEGIPPVVVQKFNDWHNSRITMLYDFLNDICDSQELFDSNIARTKIVFDFFVHLLNLTIVDARKTLVTLNGQLDPVVYKGISSEKR